MDQKTLDQIHWELTSAASWAAAGGHVWEQLCDRWLPRLDFEARVKLQMALRGLIQSTTDARSSGHGDEATMRAMDQVAADNRKRAYNLIQVALHLPTHAPPPSTAGLRPIGEPTPSIVPPLDLVPPTAQTDRVTGEPHHDGV